MFIKCSILKHQVHEQVDYFVFRSKLLIFTVNTRQVIGEDNKKNWSVRRFETDFYTLRNILVLAFGQCFVPPLVPTSKESSFDAKSLVFRERSFARFLRGIVRSAELSNHPMVREFLKVDHHSQDEKNGMKEF